MEKYEYQIINPEEVRTAFRRGKGKASNSDILQGQAIGAAVDSAIKEVNLAQYRLLDQEGVGDPSQNKLLISEAETKSNEAKALAGALVEAAGVDPVPAVVRALEERLGALEQEHVQVTELVENHKDYDEDFESRELDQKILEAGLLCTSSYIKQLKSEE